MPPLFRRDYTGLTPVIAVLVHTADDRVPAFPYNRAIRRVRADHGHLTARSTKPPPVHIPVHSFNRRIATPTWRRIELTR